MSEHLQWLLIGGAAMVIPTFVLTSMYWWREFDRNWDSAYALGKRHGVASVTNQQQFERAVHRAQAALDRLLATPTAFEKAKKSWRS
jgi:hypothetical protein